MDKLEFVLNGKPVQVEQVPAGQSLLDLLRNRLGLLGTKEGCAVGECGACTVLLDGLAVNSCLTAAWQAQGRLVETIEGMAPEDGLHPLQEAFVQKGAVQCGFCTPGVIMSSAGLLRQNPDPDAEEVKTALAGNICRCTGYAQILEAVREAARKLSEDSP